jgi:hypothetical protein
MGNRVLVRLDREPGGPSVLQAQHGHAHVGDQPAGGRHAQELRAVALAVLAEGHSVALDGTYC